MATNNQQTFTGDDTKHNGFCPEKFVENLLTQGLQSSCDDTAASYNDHTSLPPFYDAQLYTRGQQFYKKHTFALFLTKLLGLICVLALPTINKILCFTKMSSTDLTAYRRYLSTIFHMCVWYREDFQPGSKLWQSIGDVRKKHNSASKRSCTAGLHRINQRDMALTQFGFMGLAVTKREKLGIFNASEEELKSFIHVWRVVGFLMGIDDQFNICRDSVQETTDICNIIIRKAFLPEIEKKDGNFLTMARYLINGMWCFHPILSFKVFMNYLVLILKDVGKEETVKITKDEEFLAMTNGQRRKLKFVIFTIWTLKYTIFRWYHNLVHKFSLWLMKVFPFLAYYKFGKANSHVHIP